MQYLLLIYENEANDQKRSPQEMGQYFADYGTFTKAIIASGAFKAGDALEPTSAARSVRVRDGETVVTEGPFAETHEALGGYYLVEAPSLEEACAIAGRIPTAKYGTVEVRPVKVYEG